MQGLNIPSFDTSVFSQLDNPELACYLDEFTPTIVEELFDSLKKTKLKSCILDPVPRKLLSSQLDVILPIIADIVNSSLATSYIPSTFKKTALHPTLKMSAMDYDQFSPSF